MEVVLVGVTGDSMEAMLDLHKPKVSLSELTSFWKVVCSI
jgi:hypothetical protein